MKVTALYGVLDMAKPGEHLKEGGVNEEKLTTFHEHGFEEEN